MKKTVQFKKELEFNTEVSEITSISLEHNLKKESDNLISGEFLVIGEYKITDVSINTESFEFTLPFDISIDDRYEISNVEIDINDFYYELVNNEKLLVDIEVSLDKLEEVIEIPKEVIEIEEERIEVPIKEYIEEITKLTEEEPEVLEEVPLKPIEVPAIPPLDVIKEEVSKPINIPKEVKEEIEIRDKDPEELNGYVTYKVYIMKEEDTVETILHKYSVDRDVLEQYNNLSNISIGDKLIIPKND